MTPMVYFKYSIVHGKILNTLFKFIIEYGTACIHILVIYSYRQYKVEELPCRNTLSPGHFSACFQCIIHILQMIFGRIVCNIRQRHICIHELHCLETLPVQCVKNIEIFSTDEITALLKSLGNTTVFIETFIV